MDTSPSSAVSEPSGSAAASVEPSALSTPTPSDAAVVEVAAVPTTPSDTEPVEYRYEFSHYWEGKLYFVHLWADNDLAACQRVACWPIALETIAFDKLTGVGFFQHDGFKWSFVREVYKPSFVLDTDCKPLSEELTKKKPTVKVDNILDGLI